MIRSPAVAAVVFAGVLGLAVLGCGPRYRLNAQQAESPVARGDCPVAVYDAVPNRPWSLVGEVEPEDPGRLATDEQAFVAAVREATCKHGGNAIIVVKDEQGRYVRGTAINVR
jgi:hypothetical protein